MSFYTKEAARNSNSTETQLESTVRFFLVITHADPIQIGSSAVTSLFLPPLQALGHKDH